MKKLIIIFIPLLSFGQINNKKVGLLKTRFVELNMKENIALSEMLESNKIKSNNHNVRLEKLKNQFFKTKFILNKIPPNIPNLNKMLLDSEIRFANNIFQFKVKNKWLSDVEFISFLIKNKEDNFLNKNGFQQIKSDLHNSNTKYFFIQTEKRELGYVLKNKLPEIN